MKFESAERRTLPASRITGLRVLNSEGRELGQIEELMIDRETGMVAYAAMSYGGVMGVGEKLIALPWSSLRVDLRRGVAVTDLSKDRLKNSPGFDRSHWPDHGDSLG